THATSSLSLSLSLSLVIRSPTQPHDHRHLEWWEERATASSFDLSSSSTRMAVYRSGVGGSGCSLRVRRGSDGIRRRASVPISLLPLPIADVATVNLIFTTSELFPLV
uniref:Uncharacterized protein n=1 Tax=Triticum urartu TaxID=4572 RepID=A0A8R7PMF8_TRIUA